MGLNVLSVRPCTDPCTAQCIAVPLRQGLLAWGDLRVLLARFNRVWAAGEERELLGHTETWWWMWDYWNASNPTPARAGSAGAGCPMLRPIGF